MVDQDQNQKHLINEDDPALQNLERVERQPIVSSAPGQMPDIVDRYQGGVVSGLGLQPDIINSQLPGKSPVFRLMPVSIAGNPQTNAAIQSTAKSTGGGGNSGITLEMPTEFNVSGSPGTVIDVTWKPEPANWVLAGPPAGAFAGGTLDVTNKSTGSSTTGAVAATPAFAGDVALVIFSAAGVSIVNPTVAGFTNYTSNFSGSDAHYQFFGWEFIPTASTVNASTGVLGASVNWSMSLSLFGSSTGLVPVAVQNMLVGSGVITPATNYSNAFGSPNTAGNGIFVVLTVVSSVPNTPFTGYTVSDTQANTYYVISDEQALAADGTSIIVLFAPDIKAGANTVTFNSGAGAAAAGGVTIAATEFSGIGTLNTEGIPAFRALVPADIPSIPLSSGVSGILPLQNGGTSSDLSGTGGTNQVLKQSSVGAPITIGTLAASNLSNGTTGSGAVVLATSATLVTPIATTPKWTAFTVATLPAGAEGQYAYASDGRKVGEGAGTGTGVPVYFSNALWRVFSTDAQVLA